MRKIAIFFIFILVANMPKVNAQHIDSVCKLPIYAIIDSTFYSVIDSLFVTESSLGITTNDSCDILVTTLQWSDGSEFIVRRVLRYQDSTSIDCILCRDSIMRLTYYGKHKVWIFGRQTSDRIMRKTDCHFKTRCSVSRYENIIEDDTEFTIPHITIYAKHNGNNVEIKRKIDNNGNVIQ